MRLSRLYSNKPNLLEPIIFNRGLNVVRAEIRLPENQERDTHNLGKTTLGSLLDFCLLSGRNKNHFLFKHADLFGDFVFFLEIECDDQSYVTVRRSVSRASKIAFAQSNSPGRDLTDTPSVDWDHWNVPFKRAKQLLDGFLDLQDLSPWDFRKGLGYLLRSQRDYQRVFQLSRYVTHADWKPYVAHVLGFDSAAIQGLYELEDEIDDLREQERQLAAEAGGPDVTASKVDGLLVLRNNEVDQLESDLAALDFASADENTTNEVVDSVDVEIAELNQERYALSYNRRQLQEALEVETVRFDPDGVEELFNEMNVLFEGQIKRDFQHLVSFNNSITAERRGYLEEELAEVTNHLEDIAQRLLDLNRRRARALQSLGDSDSFQRYRDLSQELVTMKADVLDLKRQREHLGRVEEVKTAIEERSRVLRDRRVEVESDIRAKSDSKHDGVFTRTRLAFGEIIKSVLDKDAVLTVELNAAHHPEFRAELLDESGDTTSADEGVSYRKLLCVAFDLAVLNAHLEERFPRFAYHDGIFEGLDPRKKSLLAEVLREQADAGLQLILTTLASDAPVELDVHDVVLTLHDEGEDGLLFKMPSW